MGTGTNKLYPIVDDEAKKNLVVFQAKEGFRTRDDAVEHFLHMLPIWQAQEDLVKKLQADLEEAKKLNRELQDQVKSSGDSRKDGAQEKDENSRCALGRMADEDT